MVGDTSPVPVRDDAVSLIRLTGMTFILLCHLFTWFGLFPLTQLFNVGVPLFLMVSGYLYAEKELRPLAFLRRRYIKVTVPALLFLAFLCVFYLFSEQTPVWKTLPLYLFNLQGAYTLCGFIPQTEFCAGAGHLWFLSALFLCYLCVLPLKCFRLLENLSVRRVVWLALLSSAAVAALTPARIYLKYLQIFLIGYGCKKSVAHVRTKSYVLCTGLMALAMAMRLLVHLLAEETVWYVIVAALSHNVLAFWIFLTFKWFAGLHGDLVRRIAQNRIVRHLDALSYPVYIVHYVFLVGPFEADAFGLGKGIGLLIFLLETVLCAEALLLLTSIPARIRRKKRPSRHSV